MNWEAIGAFGEVTGSLAVLVTLIYFASQVRHIKRQIEADGRNSEIDAIMQMRCQMASDEGLAELVVKANSNEPLSPVETIRFHSYIGAWVQVYQRIFLSHLEGIQDDLAWEAAKKYMPQFAASEAARRAFLENVVVLHPLFRKEVERLFENIQH